MSIPKVEEAEFLLAEAYKLNKGDWYGHSLYCAKAACNIAREHSNLDPDRAYVLGLLHDIGRRVGNYNMRHGLDGYKYLMGLGYDDAARICITHLFPYKNINAPIGQWDCTPEEKEFIGSIIYDVEYTTYERLVQLCDYLAMPDGFTFLERRLVDVTCRYGVDEYTISRWRELFRIKEYFENILNKSIYCLLPGIASKTFEIKKNRNK